MNRFLKHILVWVFIYVVYTMILGVFGNLQSVMLVNLVHVVMFMLAFYSLRYIQLPLFYERNKKGWFAVSLIGSALILYMIYRFGFGLLDGVKGLNTSLQTDRLADILVKVIRFYSPAMVLLALESHFKGKKEQARIRKLEKEKLSNELKFIKAQINPHFLFNTLSSLHEYVLNDSPKAPDMIMRLSGILDYVLYKSQHAQVPLREEIETIENFLELEKLRFEESMHIDFKEGGDTSVLVSPLILFSLIEQPFKYNLAKDDKSQHVKINIEERENKVFCKIKSDPVAELGADQKIQIDKIKRHLELVYPNSYELNQEIKDKALHLELIINLKDG